MTPEPQMTPEEDAAEERAWREAAEATERAWSNRYESDDEARSEMEADDARFGPFDPWGDRS